MSLFNLKRKRNKNYNRAGGEAYTQSPKMKLVSILLTSFAQDQYYRSAKVTFSELIQLMSELDPLFVAKAGIYARTQFGMRSISHLLAAELSTRASGQPWAKQFYDKIVKRPDDMLEIVAYHYGKGGEATT